jgi:predicted DNA-binding transcriptional regulator AlpA
MNKPNESTSDSQPFLQLKAADQNEPTPNSPLLLQVKAAAQACDVSPDHLRRLADLGAAPAPLRLGRAVRWRRVDLERWIEQGCPRVRPLNRRRGVTL